jgi:predicted TIM-barrel fold metal-dependent hydrolase
MYHGGWSLADFEALSPSLELAEAADAPVLIHVNEPVGHSYPGKIAVDFRGLLRIIKAYPRVTFILAHFGGGVFIYGLMPEIASDLTRTYLDTAASPFLYHPQIFDIATRILGPDKILFGSDYPLLTTTRYVKQIADSGIPDELKAGIMGENAARLFQSPQKRAREQRIVKDQG